MNKTFFKYVFLLSFTAIGLTQCGKKLDIEPRQSVDAADALQTTGDVESAIIGAYSTLGDGPLYGNNLLLLPELIVANDNIDWYGTFKGYNDIYNAETDKFNPEAERTWAAAYSAINIANNVRANLNVVTEEDVRTKLEGEALFIRGLMYFELVRLFANPDLSKNGGLAVPLVLTPSTNEEQASQKAPRNTVTEVYTSLINDLTQAIELLPETSNPGRATSWAAKAIMARVRLQRGEYDQALTLANDVIENGGFSLNSGVTAVFYNKNTPESIFEIQQNDQNTAFDSNDGLTTFYGNWPNGVGRADIEISYGFHESYDPADKRFQELFGFGAETSPYPDGLYTKKWKELGQNIPIIRLAEMYLIRAECNLRLGSSTGASPEEDLAVVRTRAGLPAIPNPTLEDVLMERRYELAFEGFRSHDYKRLQKTGEDIDALPWNADRYVLPIPERERLANDQLIQNAGY
jgi:tetratricopeptide (TPR) repeat protein